MFISHKKLCKYIEAGRTAIESRMLGIIIHPRASTEADEAEMASLHALYKQYNALMSPAELPASKTAKSKTSAVDKHPNHKQGEPT
ncbi:hypothetical protein [Gallionella capsiferriformans]|uniref:Uncharacterized protein n=1 Tax=Gallionella capsiferriformans (strain ES-2) TaxID=395494 RepID=D9SDK1_GALCS|nr:hypothetical protein [Gallionella capsiferriformans]ADL54758.1 hypothetical protein Galf_0719 [Gallionella capsiferriformans ES-2]